MTNKLYWDRKAAGVCVRCGKPKTSERSECERCAQKRRKSYTQRYLKRTLEHRCGRCGRAMPEDWYFVLCAKCKDKQDSKYVSRKIQ